MSNYDDDELKYIFNSAYNTIIQKLKDEKKNIVLIHVCCEKKNKDDEFRISGV